MKRIIYSLSIIVAVVAVVSGATVAFYGDTETSAGNILVAGELDLLVNHTLATYNGEVCQNACDKTIVSDVTAIVVETGNPAVPLTFVHSAWTADLDGPAGVDGGHAAGAPNNGLNDGSYWIWSVDGVSTPTADETYTFRKTFLWGGAATGGTLYVASDNSHVAKVNGVTVGTAAAEQNFRTTDEDIYPVGAIIVPGTNTIEIQVKNWALQNGTPTSNPAGLLFKLVISGECNQSIFSTGGTCTLWQEKDVEEGDHFWMFGDVKPGDYGTNIISLHAKDNDAWSCLLADNVNDDENDLIEPEADDGDTTFGPLGNGELADLLEWFFWDDDGDGIYEPLSGETPLAGPGAQIDTEIVQMSLTGNSTEYVGIAWCAGTQAVDVNGNISCNGSNANNTTQTDSLTIDFMAYAEQQRHNQNFDCSDVFGRD